MKQLLAAIFFLVMLGHQAAAQDGFHSLALQLSDGDPHKMSSVLNVAANVSRHYSGIGEEVEIRIVAFDQGLNMLRPDKSPVAERMHSFAQSMPNVTFVACGNTMATMERNEGKPVELFEGVEIVETGVAALMELDSQGFTIIRP